MWVSPTFKLYHYSSTFIVSLVSCIDRIPTQVLAAPSPLPSIGGISSLYTSIEPSSSGSLFETSCGNPHRRARSEPAPDILGTSRAHHKFEISAENTHPLDDSHFSASLEVKGWYLFFLFFWNLGLL